MSCPPSRPHGPHVSLKYPLPIARSGHLSTPASHSHPPPLSLQEQEDELEREYERDEKMNRRKGEERKGELTNHTTTLSNPIIAPFPLVYLETFPNPH